ncbi:PD-(D/E)XK nuclease family protein [Bradyrhizobium sp. CNPSo 4010]|uniref:PD-(D/E)XK nuclease family protein n=1 Tax=Bradyrhizobium agreste TaxID=2751811 RepID=A0ABS0PGU6_9BRAD|nr:PD-(D/E)XK nuclease family protein [Bradyrhizobium agreste]MBH5396419.1 PD-(D/E)XK nuclease family protein [Bradyrhizobium agreste]
MSECLADFFNRLPHEAKIAFVQKMFVPPVCAGDWRSSISDVTNVNMKTQYEIPNGRLDIVILLDNKPTFVIENKVAAPIGKRSDNVDQLRAYGAWLKRTADRAGQKFAVLCLLTHITDPPEDFKEDQRDQDGTASKVVRWSQIAGEVQVLANSGTLPLDVRTFAREFHLFLLEQNMTTEFARFEDFAAAIVYVKSGTRISSTFEKIYDHVSELGGPFVRGFYQDDAFVDFDSETNLIHGWKYLSADPIKTLCFAYGICLQPRRSLANEALPDEDSIFLSIGVETRRERNLLEARSKDLGPEWHHVSFPDQSVLATFRPLHPALAEPKLFASTMTGWIDQSHSRIAELIRALQKQYA